jgi:cytochrome oxidase Cu insertion factor (SCO1/SenC/PrrC family)
MRTRIEPLALVSLLLFATALQSQQIQRRDGDLREGVKAPDFAIKDVDGKKEVKLSALQGKPTVLIFGSCT